MTVAVTLLIIFVLKNILVKTIMVLFYSALDLYSTYKGGVFCLDSYATIRSERRGNMSLCTKRNENELNTILYSLRVIGFNLDKHDFFDEAERKNTFNEDVIDFTESKRDRWPSQIRGKNTVKYLYDIIHIAREEGKPCSDYFTPDRGIDRIKICEDSKRKKTISFGKDRRKRLKKENGTQIQNVHLIVLFCRLLNLDLEDLLFDSNKVRRYVKESEFRKKPRVYAEIFAPLAIMLSFSLFWYSFKFSENLKKYFIGFGVLTALLIPLVFCILYRYDEKKLSPKKSKRIKLLITIAFAIISIFDLIFFEAFARESSYAFHMALEAFEGPVWIIAIPMFYFIYIIYKYMIY